MPTGNLCYQNTAATHGTDTERLKQDSTWSKRFTHLSCCYYGKYTSLSILYSKQGMLTQGYKQLTLPSQFEQDGHIYTVSTTSDTELTTRFGLHMRN